MKKLLLASLFTLFVSISYAGSGCGGGGCDGGDKKEGETPKTNTSIEAASTLLAGGSCGDKSSCGDKDATKKTGLVTVDFLAA